MSLSEEIAQKSKEIYTDKYSTSIGELISMYRDKEIDIHPEFQRFFRWSLAQKSRLIESFLLNFPVPPIFVNQREDGVWDVVDGLQRLSTIFQFVGVYKDENGVLSEPLTLEGTKLLPSLSGKRFSDDEHPENSLSSAERLFLKKARIDLIILKKESDKDGKYEVFQRLNTGGSSLSNQEVRNCIMVMTNSDLFKRFCNMSKYENFVNTICLSDRDTSERYDLELLTRFICLRHDTLDNIKGVSDLSMYLDDNICRIFNDPAFDWDEEERIFKATFDYLAENLSDNSFRKFDIEKEKFVGNFNIAVFEMLAICIGIKNAEHIEGDLFEKVKGLWQYIKGEEISWKGYSASGRLNKTIPVGNRLYE